MLVRFIDSSNVMETTHPLYTFPKLPPPMSRQCSCHQSIMKRDLPMQFCFVYNVSGSVPPLILASSFDISCRTYCDSLHKCAFVRLILLNTSIRTKTLGLRRPASSSCRRGPCICTAVFRGANGTGSMAAVSCYLNSSMCSTLCGVVAVVIRVSRGREEMKLLRYEIVRRGNDGSMQLATLRWAG